MTRRIVRSALRLLEIVFLGLPAVVLAFLVIGAAAIGNGVWLGVHLLLDRWRKRR
jgi:hypothetical protein